MATIRDKYILDIETTGSLRGLNNAATASNNLGGSLGRVRGVAAAAAGALAAVGAVNVAGSLISQFTEYEKLNTQLTTYLGSSEAARSEMDRLKTLANTLPQDLQDIASAFVIFTRTGVDTSTESLKAFSNVATANAKSMDQLGEAVADALTGEFERLKEFGVKVSKEGGQFAVDMGNNNKIIVDSAQEVVDAVRQMGEESGKFGSAAANNADTLNQSFSNLKGQVFEAAIAFGEGIKPGLQEVTKALSDLITNNKDLITSFGTLIGGALAALPDMFKSFYSAVEPLGPVFEIIGNLIKDLLWPMLKTIFEVIGALAGAVAPLAESLFPALNTVFQGTVDVIKTVVEWIQKLIQGLVDTWNKAEEMAAKVSGSFGRMKDGAVDGVKGAYDGVTGWFGDMYDEVVGNSIVPDMVDEVLGEFNKMNGGMSRSIREGSLNVASGFDGVARTINQGFDSYVDSALAGVDSQIANITRKVLNSMGGLSNTLGSVFGGLFGGGGGGGGGGLLDSVIGGIGSLFGGFFANGGSLPAGKFGVVGERGPELITGPANITPFDQMGGQQQVIYNINAVDARSFRDMLARDPGYIHALAQKGGSRVPGRFA